jgi:ABC-2 type transport system permease protein
VTRDVLTVMWKEWRELLWHGGSLRGGRLSLVVLLGVFGVLLPYQSGASWLTSPGTMFYWGWVPLMLVAGAIADSFAGERERHTLETLLASRLPDGAILIGKVAAAVTYGWVLVMLMLALSVVTVNTTVAVPGLLMFPRPFAVGAPVVALLGAGLAASAGVLVSLRAATVRQAAQTLNVSILLLLLVPVLLSQALPDAARAQWGVWAASVGAEGIVWAVAAVLLVLDAALFAAAMWQFQRARLILD